MQGVALFRVLTWVSAGSHPDCLAAIEFEPTWPSLSSEVRVVLPKALSTYERPPNRGASLDYHLDYHADTVDCHDKS